MKKLNNKGFAISTILYSLLTMAFLVVALLISHMSNNRANTSTLVRKIEDELNRYSESSTEFDKNLSDGQEYIVPYGKAGWYKIELWGAAGGGSKDGTERSNGAYTSGIIYLEENDYLYFYLGKQASAGNTAGGFNGGGSAAFNGGGGGGATDVRLENGGWNDTKSLQSRIMVAAGGAGQNSSKKPTGAGGTLSGKTINFTPGGATQDGGNSFGIGANATGSNGGGGGGYYGGRINEGGSSYISGYAGVNSLDSSGNHIRDVYHEQNVLVGEGSALRQFNFINGYMAAGVNPEDGAAKIELISQADRNNPPTRKNPKFTNITKIEDCISGETGTSTANKWLEIQAISGGRNVAKGRGVANTTNGTYATNGLISDNQVATATGDVCATITLDRAYNLDEIAVWHSPTTTARYKNHRLYTTDASGKRYELEKASGDDLYESATGFHYTPWQPDSAISLKDGNYYIYSGLTENGSISMTPSNKNVELKLFTAAKTQKWYIEKVQGNYYKVVETSNAMSLQNADGTNEDGENVSAHTKFGNHDWELWEITPTNNGTYSIRSKLGPYLTVNATSKDALANINLRTTYTGDLNQRFRFVTAEY